MEKKNGEKEWRRRMVVKKITQYECIVDIFDYTNSFYQSNSMKLSTLVVQ